MDACATRACDQIRAAIERGVPGPGPGKLEDLAPLRGTAPFEALLRELPADD